MSSPRIAVQRTGGGHDQRRDARHDEGHARQTMTDRVGRTNEHGVCCHHRSRETQLTHPRIAQLDKSLILYAAAMTIADADRRRAMAAGFAAIALWGALAALSVSGRADPAVPDGCHDVRGRRRRSASCARPAPRASAGGRSVALAAARVWLLGIGGLFGYHALYFAALQLAPPAEANLVNYLWPLLIVLLSAPLAGERLGWPHLARRLAGLRRRRAAGLRPRTAASPARHALGYALALGCAFAWSLYSVLSRRFGETPTDAIAALLRGLGDALAGLPPAVRAHGLAGHDRRPGSPSWRSASARPARAFYLWDHAVKRGDIRALGALSYATPILSTALLIACGLAEPTGALLIAALLVTVGAVLASRELWRR